MQYVVFPTNRRATHTDATGQPVRVLLYDDNTTIETQHPHGTAPDLELIELTEGLTPIVPE